MVDCTMITEAGGAEICVCSAHHLEHCLQCSLSFEDLNERARDEAFSTRHCENSACNSSRAGSRCAGCSNAWYCSRGCQRAHWRAGHRRECAAMGEDVAIAMGGECEPERRLRNGTRVLRRDRSGRKPPRDLRATIMRFIPGNGPYEDPLVDFDPRTYPGYVDGDLCRYAIRYADGGANSSGQTICCQDVHDEWEVLSS